MVMQMKNPSIAEKRTAFRDLHRSGCFVIPNPWDIGSARALSNLGFKALATTSSGNAWSKGRADGQLSRSETLEHMRMMVSATDLPVSADYESGFAASLDDLSESVRLAIETGVAGFSLEDSTGNKDIPIRGIAESAERIGLARSVIDGLGGGTFLIGRADNFFQGIANLDDTIIRLQAYAEAGADCLYAPGITTREQIEAVIRAVAPKPVNVLIGGNTDLTVEALAKMGVRRISLGGGLARAAWGGFFSAAKAIAEQGRFDCFASAPSGSELNELFR